jgi:hypothetical protein
MSNSSILSTRTSRILAAALGALAAHIVYGAAYSSLFYFRARSIVGLGTAPEQAALSGFYEWLQLSLACGTSILICQMAIEKWCHSMATREMMIFLLCSFLPIQVISWCLFPPTWRAFNGIWIEYNITFRTSPIICGVPFLLFVNLLPRLREKWLKA